MRTVHKATLTEIRGEVLVGVPPGAKFIKFDSQYNQPTLWYLCDPTDESVEIRTILLLMTGETTEHDLSDYLGTALLAGDSYVVHAFDITI